MKNKFLSLVLLLVAAPAFSASLTLDQARTRAKALSAMTCTEAYPELTQLNRNLGELSVETEELVNQIAVAYRNATAEEKAQLEQLANDTLGLLKQMAEVASEANSTYTQKCVLVSQNDCGNKMGVEIKTQIEAGIALTRKQKEINAATDAEIQKKLTEEKQTATTAADQSAELFRASCVAAS